MNKLLEHFKVEVDEDELKDYIIDLMESRGFSFYDTFIFIKHPSSEEANAVQPTIRIEIHNVKMRMA